MRKLPEDPVLQPAGFVRRRDRRTRTRRAALGMTGEIISKYRILGELGQGGMGTVYKAQDIFLGRFAALKLISERYAENAEAVARFEREGQAASSLLHPNICTVFETGRYRNRPFLAME